MPYIDLGSSIVESFAKGKQVAQQRIALQQQKEKDVADEEFRKQQLEQAQKQFETEQANIVDQHKATLALQQAEQKRGDAQFNLQKILSGLQFQKDTEQTGLPAPTYSQNQDSLQSTQIKPGVAGTTSEYTSNDSNFPSYTALDPQAAAARDAERQRMILGPAAENAQNLEVLKQEQKSYDDNVAFLRALEVARINGEYRLAASKNTKDAIMDRPIPPNIQRDTFGLDQYDPNLTYRTAQGQQLIKALTPAQQDKLTIAQTLREDAAQAQQLLEQYKYENYFKGGEGYIAGIGGKLTESKTSIQGGMTDSAGAAIRNKLGAIADRVKKENEGTAFTASEKPFLVSHAPTQFRDATPEQAKSTLESFIADQDKLIGLLIKGEGAAARPNIGNTPKIIKYDAQGNRIN